MCDALKGLPGSINAVGEFATLQTCLIHLILSTFRFTSKNYWEETGKDLGPIYAAPLEGAARECFDEFNAKWGERYPAITKQGTNVWNELLPFLE